MLGLFLERLVIGRNFAFQNAFGLAVKTAKNTNNNENSLKQLLFGGRGCLLLEGYLHLRFGGLIYYFFGGGGGVGGLLSEFYAIAILLLIKMGHYL